MVISSSHLRTGEPGPDDRSVLVREARTGDPDAWERLYRSVYPRLRAWVSRRVPTSAVDDVLSETMERAVAGIEQLRGDGLAFDGWLFGIARNVCADLHRRNLRTERTDQRVPLDTSQPSLDEDLERRDDHERVRAAFARLSPAEQELLELRVVAGLSSDAVAAALGKRPGAIRMGQTRALAHLRELIGEL